MNKILSTFFVSLITCSALVTSLHAMNEEKEEQEKNPYMTTLKASEFQEMDPVVVENAGFLSMVPVEILHGEILNRLEFEDLRSVVLLCRYVRSYSLEHIHEENVRNQQMVEFLVSRRENIKRHKKLYSVLWQEDEASALEAGTYRAPLNKLPLMRNIQDLMRKGISFQDIDALLQCMNIPETHNQENASLLEKQNILLKFADKLFFQGIGHGIGSEVKLEIPTKFSNEQLYSWCESFVRCSLHRNLHIFPEGMNLNSRIAHLNFFLKATPEQVESIGKHASTFLSGLHFDNERQDIIQSLLNGTPEQIEAIADHTSSFFSDRMDWRDRSSLIEVLLESSPEKIHALGKNALVLFSSSMSIHLRKSILNDLFKMNSSEIEDIALKIAQFNNLNSYKHGSYFIRSLSKATLEQAEAIGKHSSIFALMEFSEKLTDATIKKLLKYEPQVIDNVGNKASHLFSIGTCHNERSEIFYKLFKEALEEINGITKPGAIKLASTPFPQAARTKNESFQKVAPSKLATIKTTPLTMKKPTLKPVSTLVNRSPAKTGSTLLTQKPAFTRIIRTQRDALVQTRSEPKTPLTVLNRIPALNVPKSDRHTASSPRTAVSKITNPQISKPAPKPLSSTLVRRKTKKLDLTKPSVAKPSPTPGVKAKNQVQPLRPIKAKPNNPPTNKGPRKTIFS